MARKRYSPEQIIRKLREAEVELAKGQTVGAVCKKLGVTANTYYRWRKELRRPKGRSGQAPEGARARERSAQEDRGRQGPGYRDPP